ncbi:hypothetical protein BGZ63DRAFT_64092 [Mariannaea sp. PMI_226]|nr:hypothetical protein BGZ63DRAFT_64092 [Mariannaea sp. PMI_226]
MYVSFSPAHLLSLVMDLVTTVKFRPPNPCPITKSIRCTAPRVHHGQWDSGPGSLQYSNKAAPMQPDASILPSQWIHAVACPTSTLADNARGVLSGHAPSVARSA